MRFFKTLFILGAILAALFLPAQKAHAIDIIFNGMRLKLDSEPLERNGVVFVPMRGIFEKMRATVNFEKSTKEIVAYKKGTKLEMTIGKKMCKVNGENKFLLQPSFEKEGRTYVPLRFISETLGCRVGWHPTTKTVAISTNPDKDPFEGVTLDDKKLEDGKKNPLRHIFENNKPDDDDDDDKPIKINSLKTGVKTKIEAIKKDGSKKKKQEEEKEDDLDKIDI